MRPTNIQRSYTIALSVYGDSRPNKRDCYTRHPFFSERFAYGVDGNRVIFKRSENQGRRFTVDKAGAFKGDISVPDFPAGEYTVHFDTIKQQYFIEAKPKVKNITGWAGNLFSAQGHQPI